MQRSKITGMLLESEWKRGTYVCACDTASIGDTQGADSSVVRQEVSSYAQDRVG